MKKLWYTSYIYMQFLLVGNTLSSAMYGATKTICLAPASKLHGQVIHARVDGGAPRRNREVMQIADTNYRLM